MVLLRMGFTMPVLLPVRRCAFTAPFHPYRHIRFRHPAVCFLWHFPWGYPRRALPGILILWSPDFPLPLPKQKQQPSGHLTGPDYTLAMLAWSSERHDTASTHVTLAPPLRYRQRLGRFGLGNGFGFFSGAQPCVFFVGFVGLQHCQQIS